MWGPALLCGAHPAPRTPSSACRPDPALPSCKPARGSQMRNFTKERFPGIIFVYSALFRWSPWGEHWEKGQKQEENKPLLPQQLCGAQAQLRRCHWAALSLILGVITSRRVFLALRLSWGSCLLPALSNSVELGRAGRRTQSRNPNSLHTTPWQTHRGAVTGKRTPLTRGWPLMVSPPWGAPLGLGGTRC